MVLTFVLWLENIRHMPHPSCGNTKTSLVVTDNPRAKLLMIENKQLLDATQLVVWHHFYRSLNQR